MTRIVFTSILSLVTLGEFFNNKYNYTIIAVQPASVDDYYNSQDSESDSSSDGKVKVSLSLLVHVLLMTYSIHYLKNRYLVKT